MIYISLLLAVAGFVAALLVGICAKKSEGRVYGKLDKAGVVTNIVLIPIYVVLSPLCFAVALFTQPAHDGLLAVLSWLVSIIISAAPGISALGLGFSMALRRKGKSKLSFVIQFAGFAAIALMMILFGTLYGNLLDTIN